MAEAVNFAASIIAVIQIAGKVVSACSEYSFVIGTRIGRLEPFDDFSEHLFVPCLFQPSGYFCDTFLNSGYFLKRILPQTLQRHLTNTQRFERRGNLADAFVHVQRGSERGSTESENKSRFMFFESFGHSFNIIAFQSPYQFLGNNECNLPIRGSRNFQFRDDLFQNFFARFQTRFEGSNFEKVVFLGFGILLD